MGNSSSVSKFGYVAKQPDSNGEIYFSISEHEIWNKLYSRQINLIQEHAFYQYLEGIKHLNLDDNGIPRLSKINSILLKSTGWQLQPVDCTISFDYFFHLLSNKKFPAAAFIRRSEDFDFVPVPDIFHEIFGHCPLLLNKEYANLSYKIGKLGVKMSKEDQKYLARIYWFTIETGLIKSNKNIEIYGGSILSSYSEYNYATTSELPLRLPFNLLDILRTPYRVDVLPNVYFNISSFEQLQEITEEIIIEYIEKAKVLGDFRSLYPPRDIAKIA
ncbi:Phenylalanine-4-hydroxylase [Xenorhabdus vietnamensis]|uniref:Phenylalanine-4-hydroxylase n=1 Tax=Xenorhabdus vietnamensis TaxID=351656 RepID=A0A1Y2SJY3_9GAMM|nr:hypothetical protein [Xenorhabdus vietnamensis]OTA18205.1 Phenylalanine-4-hydroxylase [Xenorhabdus vietnamensis]